MRANRKEMKAMEDRVPCETIHEEVVRLRVAVDQKDRALRAVNAHLNSINPGDWPVEKMLALVREALAL
jgi:hypothetical protein